MYLTSLADVWHLVELCKKEHGWSVPTVFWGMPWAHHCSQIHCPCRGDVQTQLQLWLWASFKTWGIPRAREHPCAARERWMAWMSKMAASCPARLRGWPPVGVPAGSLALKLIIPSGFGIMLLCWMCRKSFEEQCCNRSLLVQSDWIVYADISGVSALTFVNKVMLIILIFSSCCDEQ